MKIKSKLAQSTRSLVNQPVVNTLYRSALTATGLFLSIVQDVCSNYEEKVEQEYMRTINEQVVHKEEPFTQA